MAAPPVPQKETYLVRYLDVNDNAYDVDGLSKAESLERHYNFTNKLDAFYKTYAKCNIYQMKGTKLTDLSISTDETYVEYGKVVVANEKAAETKAVDKWLVDIKDVTDATLLQNIKDEIDLILNPPPPEEE
tara:strand:- start:1231 stop:1623 length:393 start_codon:yes stop_codon:yes gene_type:complete